jgi:hypothetical protein
MTWVTYLWWFTSTLKVTLEAEKSWVPEPAIEGDVALMDIALQYNFTPSQLHQLNHCRIYLQVIWVSDITAADGYTILLEMIEGSRLMHRTSSLQWPPYPRPPNWYAWRLLIQYISNRSRLCKPIGKWLHKPHQQWEWFYITSEDTHCHRSTVDASVQIYHRLSSNTPYPRRQHCTGYGDPSPGDLSHQPLLPASVKHTNESYLCSSFSTNLFPTESPTSTTNIWNPANIPPPLQDTPEFFQ